MCLAIGLVGVACARRRPWITGVLLLAGTADAWFALDEYVLGDIAGAVRAEMGAGYVRLAVGTALVLPVSCAAALWRARALTAAGVQVGEGSRRTASRDQGANPQS